jgi:L-lactate utilization protein LutC
MRNNARPRLLVAGAGITGGNFAIAEGGTFMVCTNEGNADIGAAVPPLHIASIGIEKLIPRVEDALAFLSQHLIVLLDPGEIVPDMHEAYRRVRLNETAYGCFMMGPSATADVEATLVHGAQGVRSLNVFFLPPHSAR